MSKLPKIIGAILWILAFIVGFVTFEEGYKKGPTSIHAVLTNGHGSVHSVCSETGESIDKFASVDFTTTQTSYLHYYLFSIQNAKDYLNGVDADVVERGPYVLRKFSAKYDISFKASSLSGTSDPTGAIEYSVANSYVALDKQTELASTMVRSSEDLSLSWSADAIVDIETEESRMPSYLSMSDQIVNLSPSYLKFLGDQNDEYSMALRMLCTKEQVDNIFSANPSGGKAQCSLTQMNDPNEPNCACCMLDDTYALLTLQNGMSPAYTNCNVLFDDADVPMSMISLFATYDGGVAIKGSADDKFDGSGDKFNQTAFGQTAFYTPLIQSHSANDLMFGYPSAFLGRFIPNSVLPSAMKVATVGLTKTQVAANVMTGQMDDDLTLKVGDIAKYTKDVGAVCSSTCTEPALSDSLYNSPLGWMCEGTASQRHETNVADEIALGGIDCKPYSSTFVTKLYCDSIQTTLQVAPNTPGYEACVCADGSNDWSTSGCCLAGGQIGGNDLTGFGCLYPVDGLVDPNYAGKDATTGKIDVGKAVETWISKAPKNNKVTSFMCPPDGEKDIHKMFNYYEEYGTESEIVTFYDTGNDRIQQGDALDPNAAPYASNVTGIGAEYMKATGLTAYPGTKAVSHSRPFSKIIPMFNELAKRPFEFMHNTSLYAKTCGTTDCIVTARLLLHKSNFAYDDNATLSNGQGLPFNGLQPIGHLLGMPSYIHQPFYMDGDVELYSQKNNTHVMSDTGNGITMYHGGAYSNATAAADPGAFTVGGDNINYKVVDEAWVAENNRTFESYFDVEPATGRVFSSKMSFGVSFSIWECDPQTNSNCKLAAKSKGQGRCYDNVGDEYFGSLGGATQVDYATLGRNQFTYPCSAANLMTPNVIGGKIMPMYWYDLKIDSKKLDADPLTVLANQHNVYHRIWMTGAMYFAFTFWLGAKLMFCFSGIGKVGSGDV